jgi:nucleoside 2-deoxyribosyltransferase
LSREGSEGELRPRPKDQGSTIKVYLAGPLGFSEVGSDFNKKRIIPLLRKLGHKTLDPWEDQGNVAAVLRLPFGVKKRDAWRRLNPQIGRKNQRLIDECDVIFAVLDGTDVDSGTAAEIGYGFARGKRILGYRGDFRLCADNEGGIVNLQVEYFIRASGGEIIGKIDELPAAIEKLSA